MPIYVYPLKERKWAPEGPQAWVKKNEKGPAGPKKPVTVVERDNPL